MSKHQTCPRCRKDFVGPDSHINENICNSCLLNDGRVICEVECPACGKIVEFTELGEKICPNCKSVKAELTISDWEVIEND